MVLRLIANVTDHGCPPGYDSFGNRTAQYLQSTACPAQESNLTPTDNYNANNQIDPTTKTYDAAGNTTADSWTGNTYLYDGEGRICAVKSEPVSGTYIMIGYVYDAEGNRVAKGTITSMSCDPSANGFVTAGNVTDYVLGPGGEQVSELAQDANGTMNWQRSYAYAVGALIATYDPSPDTPSQPLLSFRLTDWLGTLRATTDSSGVLQGACTDMPFGDQLACEGNMPDQRHFTGKERDSESGNDYFGARYFGSSMGRFMSPDWSAKVAPIPYAKLGDPQSLNLYAYVGNNPLSRFDPDGHVGKCEGDTAQCGADLAKLAPGTKVGGRRHSHQGWTATTNLESSRRQRSGHVLSLFHREHFDGSPYLNRSGKPKRKHWRGRCECLHKIRPDGKHQSGSNRAGQQRDCCRR
ncbi:MAG: RHS repeat-associated core domain-containing protein [Terracidiphilus sp.]